MRARRLLAALVAMVTLAGCGSIYDLPLPGAVAKGDHTFTVSVQFADALDLVPFSAVKVNDATVGHVKRVALEDRHAVVVCQLLDSVRLPVNAVARVSQTSLLGEKFVEIHPPTATAPIGRLKNGAVIELANTDTDATVEEVLSALSLLLSGGGLAQLHTIAAELNTALQGREGTARDLLVRLSTFATALDVQKAQIVAAIERVDRLAGTVKAQESALTAAVDRMPQALAILAADRKQLTGLLVSLDHLGVVATRVVKGSQADLLANLKALKPTLTKLAEVGNVIPQSLEAIITYPTADGVEKGYFGDYGNLALTVDVSSASLLNTFNPASPAPKVSGRAQAGPTVTPVTGPRTAPAHWVSGSGIHDLLLGALR
jgi:phospholipid/cholesterol/gamma-HCH transport system substrate-binding protein